MTRRIASVLLVTWGLVNAVGGALGSRQHPAPWIGLLFLAVGGLIVAGGVALWRGRSWAIGISASGLLGLSVLALLSAALLRGPGGMRPSHHLVRAAISGAIFATALAGSRHP